MECTCPRCNKVLYSSLARHQRSGACERYANRDQSAQQARDRRNERRRAAYRKTHHPPRLTAQVATVDGPVQDVQQPVLPVPEPMHDVPTPAADHHDPNQGVQQDDCAICWEPVSNPYSGLQCVHQFCTECLLRHCEARGDNARCPLCRTLVFPANDQAIPVQVDTSTAEFYIPDEVDQPSVRVEQSHREDCTICSEPIRDPLGGTHCMHRFCSHCIRRWAREHGVTAECPLCRATLDLPPGDQSGILPVQGSQSAVRPYRGYQIRYRLVEAVYSSTSEESDDSDSDYRED